MDVSALRSALPEDSFGKSSKKIAQSAKATEVGEAGSMNKTCQRRQIIQSNVHVLL